MTGAHRGSMSGRFFRLGAGPRRALVLAGLAVATLVATLPAGADAPETGDDPSVSISVSPSDGLSDNVTVTVTGSGFPAGVAGLLRLCAGTASAPACDTTRSGIFFTDPTGHIPPSPLSVTRIITTIGGGTFNCGVSPCGVIATAGGKTSRHHVSFLGAGTLPPSSTTPTTAGTIPPSSTATTVTTIPGGTTIPGSTTTTTRVVGPPVFQNLLCAILGAVSRLLGGLLDGLLNSLGCVTTG
ncbi:MAG: Neocarzinostatin family [Actinomycetota bacterium]|nr:Neocarzinostatin family [Actinomycetota bacterium]